MLLFVKQKIKNKKWLNLCLLVGIVLLTGVFSCYPLMASGAGNQLLQAAFNNYAREKGVFPTTVARNSGVQAENTDIAIAYLNRQEQEWLNFIGLPAVTSEKILSLEPIKMKMELAKEKSYLSPTLICDMEKHIDIVAGIGFEEASRETFAPGTYPCMVSEVTMDSYDLSVGETIDCEPFVIDGERLTFVITGIFREAEDGSNFWHDDTTTMERNLFVSKEMMDILWKTGEFEAFRYSDTMLLDYTYITYEKADQLMKLIEAEQEAGSKNRYSFYELLSSYKEDIRSILTVLWVLALPCVVLLILFIYMVSSQILSSEEGEIAVMRSRGMTRMQIVWLYFLQSAVLSLVGGTLGIGLGYCIGKLAAHMDGFMKFAMKDTRCYRFTWLMIPFALLGCLVSILFMTLPVFARAKMTIVQQKSTQRYVKKQPLWERFYLDVLLLLASLYLLYNYNKQLLLLASDIASGASLDPVLFLDVSLFILGCALFGTRLLRYLLLLVDKLGKKRWKPAAYASFLELTRNYGSRIFISVFLIMTIACGIYDADMARTINENTQARIACDVGADVVFKERWHMLTIEGDTPNDVSWSYSEPHMYDNFRELVDRRIASGITRVMGDDKAELSIKRNKLENVTWMAIDTKEFGENAELMDGLNEEHWFYALNALAADRNGLILSRNAAEALGVQVGDEVRFNRNSPFASQAGISIGSIRGNVAAIVDAFPSYDRYRYSFAEDGSLVREDNYLLVCNYATAQETFTLTPYSIWVRLEEGVEPEAVKSFLEEKGYPLSSYAAAETLLEENRNSAIIQATNGMFTISFLISLAICSIGFLIYWIMSLKSRELMFGIYRAMGLRMAELRTMLLIEQIFGSLLPIAAGGISGALATVLFTKLLAVVYLPKEHTIPLAIYVHAGDILQLFAIVAVVVAVCFMVLREILRRMNIVQALKLGED